MIGQLGAVQEYLKGCRFLILFVRNVWHSSLHARRGIMWELWPLTVIELRAIQTNRRERRMGIKVKHEFSERFYCKGLRKPFSSLSLSTNEIICIKGIVITSFLVHVFSIHWNSVSSNVVLDPIGFHYMGKTNWNILRNIFILVPQKKESHSAFKTTRGWVNDRFFIFGRIVPF